MAGNLRDARLRIRAIEQTLQVTKAMKLISTAKLRKGRRLLQDTEPYFDRITKSMFDILSGTHEIKSAFFRRKDLSKTSRTAIIAVTSDRGLAGGYNTNVARHVNELCARTQNPVLILIGSIGLRYFSQSPYVILENISFRSQIPTVEHAEEITDYAISQYLWGMFDEIHIVYTHMFSAVKIKTIERQIMPLVMDKLQEELATLGVVKRIEIKTEYLPSEEAVFDALVPKYINGVIYGALVEAYASEQNARMTAMDEASKSAEEMLAELRTHYNRARQAGITQEMSEIVGGSAALTDR